MTILGLVQGRIRRAQQSWVWSELAQIGLCSLQLNRLRALAICCRRRVAGIEVYRVRMPSSG